MESVFFTCEKIFVTLIARLTSWVAAIQIRVKPIFSLAKGEDFRYTLKTMGVTLDLMRGIRT